MTKYRIYISLAVVFLLSSVSVFGEKPPEGDGWNFLSKEKKVISGSDLTLLPEFEESIEFLESVKRNNPRTSLEMLYTMPLPEANEDLFLYLFNYLNKFSLMEGIDYYSSRKGGMVPYLDKSFLVEKAGSKKPLSDPFYTVLPGEISYTVFQKDSTFGSNWYNVDIKVYEDAVWLSMTNTGLMWYYFLPVLKAGGLKIDMIVIPGKENLKFYTLSQLQEEARKEVLGISIYLPGAFDHRVSALQGWFAKQIYSNPRPGQIQ